MNPMWEIKQPQAPEALELYIYGDVEVDISIGTLFLILRAKIPPKNSGKSWPSTRM